MLVSFLITSLLIGLFMSFIWSSNGFRNAAIKTMFGIYTFWAAVLLASALMPMVVASGMKLI